MLEENAILHQETMVTYTQGAGRDIVLLHGWGMHSGIWKDVLPELATRYRVTTVDFPGHGRSPPARFTLDSLVKNLEELISSKSILLGWSLGALVGQKLAISYPEKLDRLILVSGTPRFIDADDWPHATSREVFSQFSRDLEQDYRSTLKRFIYLQSKGGENAGDTRKELQNILMLGPQPDPVALKCGLDILENTDLRNDLNKIQCPVQFILGERDTLVPSGVGDNIAGLISNICIEVIASAGHAPFISHPHKFTQSVFSFIETRKDSTNMD